MRKSFQYVLFSTPFTCYHCHRHSPTLASWMKNSSSAKNSRFKFSIASGRFGRVSFTPAKKVGSDYGCIFDCSESRKFQEPLTQKTLHVTRMGQINQIYSSENTSSKRINFNFQIQLLLKLFGTGCQHQHYHAGLLYLPIKLLINRHVKPLSGEFLIPLWLCYRFVPNGCTYVDKLKKHELPAQSNPQSFPNRLGNSKVWVIANPSFPVGLYIVPGRTVLSEQWLTIGIHYS